jgi:hypothetical protein
MGIEPTSEAWEASILPLNYARSATSDYTQSLPAIRNIALGFPTPRPKPAPKNIRISLTSCIADA